MATSTAIDLTKISNMTKDFPEKIHFGKMNMLLNNFMSVKTANSIEIQPIVIQGLLYNNTQSHIIRKMKTTFVEFNKKKTTLTIVTLSQIYFL